MAGVGDNDRAFGSRLGAAFPDRVPDSFTLNSRNPERGIVVSDDVISFGLVSGPPNVHDNINSRRAGNLPITKH